MEQFLDGADHIAFIARETNPWTLIDARKTLRAGNADYMRNHKEPPREKSLLAASVEAAPVPGKYAHQWPLAAVLCCADSRVSPELLYAQPQGRLFVVRSAGNTPDDKAIANLAYAVHALQVPLIVVLGHQQCGAVGAAIADGGSGSGEVRYAAFVEPILRAVVPGTDPGNLKAWDEAVRRNVRLTAHDVAQHPHLAITGRKPAIDMTYYHFKSGLAEVFT